MNTFKKKKKVLEVYFANDYNKGGFNTYEAYYYITNLPDIKPGDIVLIHTNSGKNNLQFNLQFVLVNDIINPGSMFNDNVYVENNDDRLRKAVYPKCILTIDLSKYLQMLEDEKELKSIEKEMNAAASRLDTFLKFKQLSELDPSFKSLFERYQALRNNNLLSGSTDNK